MRRLLSYKEFAEQIGATHGSVKRWVHEGMPVNRDWPSVPRIDPGAAERWLDEHPRRPTTVRRESVVYFAERADGGIKIGFTNDVDRRMRELRKEFRIGAPLRSREFARLVFALSDLSRLFEMAGDHRMELVVAQFSEAADRVLRACQWPGDLHQVSARPSEDSDCS